MSDEDNAIGEGVVRITLMKRIYINCDWLRKARVTNKGVVGGFVMQKVKEQKRWNLKQMWTVCWGMHERDAQPIKSDKSVINSQSWFQKG